MREGTVHTGLDLFSVFFNIMKISGTAVQKIKGTIAEKTVDSALFTHIMTGIILTIPVFKIFKSIHNYGIIIHLKHIIV